ncbi:hypothetical protein B0A50_03228 [Salinomyces thailandicus]|uniref:Uncharacterized protein n=1 Tax=Salinomyces thailandicus TaxID=706561 RepID=A0A4U0U4R7_9PEZI|nr:hypothetical protein B0A50_03228 [Salinomyces thailandica]
MSIFKRKSKAKKADAKETEVQAAPAAEPAPYRHVPKHAASDAAAASTEKANREKIRAANENRMKAQAQNYSMVMAAQPQAGTPSSLDGMPPSSPFEGQQMTPQSATHDMYSRQRHRAAEAFTTDPDAPPMPTSPHLSMGRSISRSGTPRDDYFSDQTYRGAPFDGPMLGNPKMANAARDRGYVHPHTSADSGYGSVIHSRAPSEQVTLADIASQHLPRNSSGFLPELSLSEELAREPTWSEHSYEAGDLVQQSPKRAPGSVLKGSQSYLERQASQQPGDARSLKSSRSLMTLKQTRFQDAPATASAEAGQEQQTHYPARGAKSQEISREEYSSWLTEPRQQARPESATIPQPHYVERPSSPPPALDQRRPSFTVPDRHSTPSRQGYHESQHQPSLPMRMSSPPPQRENQMVPPARYASPPPPSDYAPIPRVMSPGLQNNRPLARLEGYKVNKRGLILDEEGETIGELIEGDIVDCVRQRVGEYGEVFDDNGSVVGRVRVLQRVQRSPIMRVVSPMPDLQQQHEHMQPSRPMSPALSIGRGRGLSSASQPEAFTPAWQRQPSQSKQQSLAQELRDHLAAANPERARSTFMQPVGMPNNVSAVELPASDVERQPEAEEEEEVMPVLDHSDIFMPPSFMPTPAIPDRSPRRTPTPSPPQSPEAERPRRLAGDKQLFTPMAAQPAPLRTRKSHDGATRRSVHTSAPSPVRQYDFLGPMYGPEPPPVASSTAEESQASAKAQQTPKGLRTTASDTSISTLNNNKSYATPSISPVPENGQLDQTARSPALFAYKGEVPTTNASGPALAPPPRPKSAVSFKGKNAFHGINSAPFQPLNSAQYSSAGRLGPPRFSTGSPGPRPNNPGRASNSFNAPMKRSPLSSHGKSSPSSHYDPFMVPTPTHTYAQHKAHETYISSLPAENSPPESDEGSEGDKYSQVNGHFGRQAPAMYTTHSSRSMPTSASTTANKPRTYFTHGGRVTVQGTEGEAAAAAKMAAANQAAGVTPAAAPSASATAPVAAAEVAAKRKSRFSLGFGRKG